MLLEKMPNHVQELLLLGGVSWLEIHFDPYIGVWPRKKFRVFDLNIEHCPNCGGSLKIIACPEPRRRAAIEDPPMIDKILSHLGLSTRAPPRSPAQRFDLFQTT